MATALTAVVPVWLAIIAGCLLITVLVLALWALPRAIRAQRVLRAELTAAQQAFETQHDRLRAVDPSLFLHDLGKLRASGALAEQADLADAFFAEHRTAIADASFVLAERAVMAATEQGPKALTEARAYVQTGHAIAPNDRRIADLAADLDLRQGQQKRGMVPVMLPKQTHDPKALTEAAEQVLREGHFALAAMIADRAIALTAAHSVPHAEALNLAAAALYKLGRHREAEPLYRRALTCMPKQPGPHDRLHADLLGNLALLLSDLGEADEAETLFRDALRRTRTALGEGHPDFATDLGNLAAFLFANGRIDEAEPLFQQAVSITSGALGQSHPDHAGHLSNLALLMLADQRHDEAEILFRQAAAITMETLGETHPDTAIRLNNLGLFLLETDRLAEASETLGEARRITQATLPEDHPQNEAARYMLALLDERMADDENTVKTVEQAKSA